MERQLNQAEEAKYVKGVVTLSKISVCKLPKMDVFNKTDPYGVFSLGDSTKQTTVAEETLDYDYLNETYEIIYDPLKMNGNREMNVSVYDYDSFRKKEVDIEVWDYDTAGFDDQIGIASFDV
ncbi:MAG: hypothetical protein EZS28_032213 [Streblomastix strix]|uniref:C2 domain-containing protein n=1 Tax=Streblomastix strix TaxID=222440 RepID=A0A5J4UQC2_9EUKA|nr:MAG: hypothetical protein EZS28_032213 [Streblomastix strix]